MLIAIALLWRSRNQIKILVVARANPFYFRFSNVVRPYFKCSPFAHHMKCI